MDTSRPGTKAALAIALAATLLTGCGGQASAGRAVRSPAQVEPSPAPVAVHAPEPDARACAGVQALIGHLTLDTQGWSPTRHPFDRAVAAHIRVRATELGAQGRAARTPRVRNAVRATSDAFTGVAEAMGSHDRARVDHAVTASRTAYRQLLRACPQ